MILFCAVLIWFARSPASLTAVLVFSCGAMLGNDTVARNVKCVSMYCNLSISVLY